MDPQVVNPQSQQRQQGFQCAFAVSPLRQEYCSPGPFSQVYGQRYHNLTNAYGQSRRVER